MGLKNININIFYENICKHISFYTLNSKFCKNCGLFFPKSNNEIIRNKYYKYKKFNVNPNIQYKMMLKKIDRIYNPYLPFKNYRKQLIEYIYSFCKKLNFSFKTFILSCSILDQICNEILNMNKNIYPVLITCIIISAKYEEPQKNIPNIKNIKDFLKNKFTESYLLKLEKYVLININWKLNINTVLDFSQFFLKAGILKKKEIIELYNTNNNEKYDYNYFEEKVMLKFETLWNKLIYISVLSYDMYDFSTLSIATACIAISKKIMNFSEIWNNELIELTYLNWNDIQIISNKLLNLYKFNYNLNFRLSEPQNLLKNNINKIENNYKVNDDISTNESIKNNKWNLNKKNKIKELDLN